MEAFATTENWSTTLTRYTIINNDIKPFKILEEPENIETFLAINVE
jgi:hypothetical protein